MAIVKTTYESGAVSYEHVESLVQTGAYMFRFYGKNDFFDREVDKGDQIEVLSDKVVAYAANCPDVTIPDESEGGFVIIGDDTSGCFTFPNERFPFFSDGTIEKLAEKLSIKNANAEYLKESEESKANSDESDNEKDKKLFGLCKSLAYIVGQERSPLKHLRSDTTRLCLSNRKEKLVNKIASLFNVE